MNGVRESPQGILDKLAHLLVVQKQGGQGEHIDPELHSPSDMSAWGEDQRSAWFSDEMKVLRDCVCFGAKGPRQSILEELAEFHRESIEDAYRKCIEWEKLSIAEWKAADRSTPQGVTDFYNTTTSWRYDLAWYAYLQVTGHSFPQGPAVVRFLRENGAAGGELLDFGSGIGLNAQVFDRFGFKVTIADISRPLLAYAIWRHARHGADIKVIDLNDQPLPATAFDVITAFDTLTHVTDFDATSERLHAALKPDGWLIANFDTRAPDDASAWHIQDNELDLDRRLKRAGFAKQRVIGGFLGCYQSIDPSTAVHGLRTLRDRVTLPLEQAASFSRRVRWPTPRRVVNALRRVSALH